MHGGIDENITWIYKILKKVHLQVYRPGSIYIISLLVFNIFQFHEIYLFIICILYSEFLTLTAFGTLELHLSLRCYQFIEHFYVEHTRKGITGTMQLLLIMYMALLLEVRFILRLLRNDG